MKVRVGDVFRSSGQPTVTYVERSAGRYERDLRSALDAAGQICLLTGASKTGKTTLYKRVLSETNYSSLIIRCDDTLSPTEFWKRGLEAINFEQIREKHKQVAGEVSLGSKIGGKLGWDWLASALGEVSVSAIAKYSELELRERILSAPSPHHLIPALAKLPLRLVVEDFHYLPEATKATVFQQWKLFVDSEISVLILGTTHHAFDIAAANKDLVGRIRQIDVSQWSEDDLALIAEKGFRYLDIPLSTRCQRLIASESVGLPIITQQCCEQLFIDRGLFDVEIASGDVEIDQSNIRTAMHNVARSRYQQLETYYETIISGPRKAARVYNTYELVLSCFGAEPVKFYLERREIETRLKEQGLQPEQIPPPASLSSTLRALQRFQLSRGIELLEWRPNERRLYIIEPSFLFYVRWRREYRPRSSDVFISLFDEVSARLKVMIHEHKDPWLEDTQFVGQIGKTITRTDLTVVRFERKKNEEEEPS